MVHWVGTSWLSCCRDQSLLPTAQLYGLERSAWLKETMEKLPAWPYSRIDGLLPVRRYIMTQGG